MEKTPKDMLQDLNPVVKFLIEYVKEHQGSKGYIRTDNLNNDSIWGFAFDYDTETNIEYQVVGVRVVTDEEDEDSIQVFLDAPHLSYDLKLSDGDFKNDNNWEDLSDTDIVFIPTVFSIASFIHEYVDSEHN